MFPVDPLLTQRNQNPKTDPNCPSSDLQRQIEEINELLHGNPWS
jgi:hypothetical protein